MSSGPHHPDTLSVMDGYATTLAEEHRNDEAEKLLQETLDIRHRVLGPDHRDTGEELWRHRGA